MPGRINLSKLKQAYDDGLMSRQTKGSGNVTLRATAKLVKNAFLQGRIGRFHFDCDEPASRGGEDKAPSPLEYFMIGAAF